MISVKDQSKYDEIKSLLGQGNSILYVSEKLNVSREIVCAVQRFLRIV